MRIEDEHVVSISYKLWDGDGMLLDESPENEPLLYIHGEPGIVPGLEEELTGKAVGDEFDITLSPDDAYGDYMPEAIIVVPREEFDEDAALDVGLQVTLESGGVPMPATIAAASDSGVTLDTNHPLAGKTLRFKGVVLDVRPATAEELEEARAVD